MTALPRPVELHQAARTLFGTYLAATADADIQTLVETWAPRCTCLTSNSSAIRARLIELLPQCLYRRRVPASCTTARIMRYCSSVSLLSIACCCCRRRESRRFLCRPKGCAETTSRSLGFSKKSLPRSSDTCTTRRNRTTKLSPPSSAPEASLRGRTMSTPCH